MRYLSVIGRKSIDFLSPEAQIVAKQVLPEFMVTGVCKAVPYTMVTKAGTEIEVLLSAIAERDSNGQITHTLAVMEDVTDRNRAEAARNRLLHILEASRNEIYLFDEHSLKFLYANRGACQNLGYAQAALMGLMPIDLQPTFSCFYSR